MLIGGSSGTEGFLGRAEARQGPPRSQRLRRPWSWWVTGASWPRSSATT